MEIARTGAVVVVVAGDGEGGSPRPLCLQHPPPGAPFCSLRLSSPSHSWQPDHRGHTVFSPRGLLEPGDSQTALMGAWK